MLSTPTLAAVRDKAFFIDAASHRCTALLKQAYDAYDVLGSGGIESGIGVVKSCEVDVSGWSDVLLSSYFPSQLLLVLGIGRIDT